MKVTRIAVVRLPYLFFMRVAVAMFVFFMSASVGSAMGYELMTALVCLVCGSSSCVMRCLELMISLCFFV